MKNCIIPADQNQRFNGTIICYKGVPYYVSMDGPVMLLYSLEQMNPGAGVRPRIAHKVDPYDDDVDISSIPLGFVNFAGLQSVVYCYRMPKRKFQQGISEHTCHFEWLPDHTKVEGQQRVYRMRDVLYTLEFIASVTQQYPTLEEALKTLKDWKETYKRGEVAISRDVALAIDAMGIIRVYYKNSQVGWIPPGKCIVNVPSTEMGWIVSMYLSGFKWEIN